MPSVNETVTEIGASVMRVGAFTYGQKHMKVRQWGEGANLNIGKFCSIAGDVTVLLGGNHRADWITTFPFGKIYTRALGDPKIVGHPATKGDVNIGNDVWIGQGAVILSGVTIGCGSVIGAHAVVSADVPPYSVAAGNPARTRRRRFPEEIIEQLLRLRWWDLDLEVIRAIAPLLSQPPTTEHLEALIEKTGR